MPAATSTTRPIIKANCVVVNALRFMACLHSRLNPFDSGQGAFLKVHRGAFQLMRNNSVTGRELSSPARFCFGLSRRFLPPRRQLPGQDRSKVSPRLPSLYLSHRGAFPLLDLECPALS